MTIKGWPDSRRPTDSIGGWGPGYPEIGNISGLPNIARRFSRFHPISRQLLAWWPMNEGVSGGNRLNNLVNPNEYALSVATTNKRVAGPMGAGAMSFGASAYATATVANLPLGSSLRSLSAWILVPTSGAGDTIPLGYGAASANSQFTFYQDSANHMLVQIYGTAIQTNFTPDGLWHHWAVSQTGATISTCKLYRDGVLQSTSLTGPDSTLATTSTAMTFGANPASLANVFPGSLANVRLYSRAVVATEVAQLFADYWIGSIGGIQ
jgi:hypothetical protein